MPRSSSRPQPVPASGVQPNKQSRAGRHLKATERVQQQGRSLLLIQYPHSDPSL
jgi:hypothetical protein